jgi:hypothetical protein
MLLRAFFLFLLKCCVLSNLYGQAKAWNQQRKEWALGFVWEKQVLNCSALSGHNDSREVLSLNVPDSQLASFKGTLDKMASMYLVTYYNFILKHRHYDFDTFEISINKVLAKPSGPDSIIGIFDRLLPMQWFEEENISTKDLLTSLMFLSPRSMYYFGTDDGIFESYRCHDTIDIEHHPIYYKNLAKMIAGISGKYLLKGTHWVHKIVVVFIDARGQPYSFVYYPGTKEFSKEFALL